MAEDSTLDPDSDIIALDNIKRCGWAKSLSMRKYHDLEWGRPASKDSFLFEILILETLQAGISWSIVLSKKLYQNGALSLNISSSLDRNSALYLKTTPRFHVNHRSPGN